MLYTIVDESYDVYVCRSFKKVYNWVHDDRICTVDDMNFSKKNLRSRLQTNTVVYIYTDDNTDWKYKIERHS